MKVFLTLHVNLLLRTPKPKYESFIAHNRSLYQFTPGAIWKFQYLWNHVHTKNEDTKSKVC